MNNLQPTYINAFLRLVRWQNLIIIAVTQYLVRYCILAPILKFGDLSLQLNGFCFFLLVLSTVLIAAAGYVINDYFDRKTDLVNKPDAVIVGKKIKIRYAMALHIIFNIVGIGTGFYLSIRIGEPLLGLIFVTVSGLLWFYSTTYKRQLLIGNIIVALLTALVPLIVFLFEYPLLKSSYNGLFTVFGSIIKYLTAWILGYSGFAFLLTLAREIIKDAEDFEGDHAYGNQTIPIVVGTTYTKGIIVILLIITLITVFYIYFTYLTNRFTLYFICIMLVIPLIYDVYKVIRADTKKDYNVASLITKIIMINGLLYALLANLVIPRFY
jgi:4-hydroxybenzoate polyprenyltransferase